MQVGCEKRKDCHLPRRVNILHADWFQFDVYSQCCFSRRTWMQIHILSLRYMCCGRAESTDLRLLSILFRGIDWSMWLW